MRSYCGCIVLLLALVHCGRVDYDGLSRVPALSCIDGIQNGTETGIDCGGECGSCLAQGFDCTVVTSISSADCDALVAFYITTDGDNWDDNTNWVTDPDPCTWNGVDCNDGAVIALTMSDNGMSGPIPPEIGNFTNILSLQLSGGQLTGNIPAEIGNVTNLTFLVLSSAQLTGSIPAEIGALTSLLNLRLNNNDLSGDVPPALMNIPAITIVLRGQSGCLSTTNMPLETWLNDKDSLWNDGCP